jgi:hypothetical protein
MSNFTSASDASGRWQTFNNRVRAEDPDFGSMYSSTVPLILPKLSDVQIDLLQLAEPWSGDLSDAVVEKFQSQRWIRLKQVIPPNLLYHARGALIALATKVNKGVDMAYPVHSHPLCMRATMVENSADAPGVDAADTIPLPPLVPPAGRHSDAETKAVEAYWRSIVAATPHSWNIQMMWAVDPFIRALVMSPRISDIVCTLLGCTDIRVYHDNCLFRVPSSKRTRWHCDDGPHGYMAMAERDVVTVWYPLQRTPPVQGSLVFPVVSGEGGARSGMATMNAWDVAALPGCPEKEMSDEYDLFVAASLEAHGFIPEEGSYEVGDISIHYTDCFHCAGPNLTDNVRMIIAVTYFADGCTMRVGGVSKFCPDVTPGQRVNSRFNPLLPHCK